MSTAMLRDIVKSTCKKYQIPAQSCCACSIYKIITMHYKEVSKKELKSVIVQYLKESTIKKPN
jgi:hypothetical protein